MYEITWGNEAATLDSAGAVERLLDELHARYRDGDPTLVTVERSDGQSLSIGLGAQCSVLNYVRGDKNPPYYTSAAESESDEHVSFRFGGAWSEYPLRATVPIAEARAAMTRFCESGQLSPDVRWEEV
jgi:hypothetical protein